MAVFYFFFAFVFAFGVALTGTLRYSRANATMHVYANNADSAVINPDSKPSEKIVNKIIAAARTTVYPKLLDSTDSNFSKDFISFPLFTRMYYITVVCWFL